MLCPSRMLGTGVRQSNLGEVTALIDLQVRHNKCRAKRVPLRCRFRSMCSRLSQPTRTNPAVDANLSVPEIRGVNLKFFCKKKSAAGKRKLNRRRGMGGYLVFVLHLQCLACQPRHSPVPGAHCYFHASDWGWFTVKLR